MKKIALLASAALIGGLLMTSCNGNGTAGTTDSTGAKSTFDLSAAKKEIDSSNKQFGKFTETRDSTGISNLYTSDAVLMAPNMPAVSGRSDIAKTFGSMMTPGFTKAELTSKDVWGDENLLAEEGVATVYVKGTKAEEDKYIALWKKEDGKWKLFRDIFNSNAPEAPHK